MFKKENLIVAALYLVFCSVFAVPLGLAMKTEIEGKRAAEQIALQERAEAEREKLASEAIKAMMHNYPQRSEIMAENEIPKIARGTTGQAKLVGDPVCIGSSEGAIGMLWLIEGPDVITPDYPPGNEWSVSSDGIVTVPGDATTGSYRAFYTLDTCGKDEYGDDKHLQAEYEFEVVCFELEVGLVYNPATPN